MTNIDPVQQIVLNCLNHFAYQDAIFLSERFHAEFQNEESLYLLALSYYRSGGGGSSKTLRAYHILKERQLKLPKSKYLLGKCCLDLNKFGEAESVLTSDLNNNQSNNNNNNNILNQVTAGATNASSTSSSTTSSSSKTKLYDEIAKEYGAEYTSYVLQILATVYCKTDRLSQAVEFYKKSLRQNPFMWSSFESICNLGEKIEPGKYFSFNWALNSYKTQILDVNNLNQVQSQSQYGQQPQQQQQYSPPPQPVQPAAVQQPKQNYPPNVLKQIDQQCENFLDQKSRQDIAEILRLVEADHENKQGALKQKCLLHQSTTCSNTSCLHYLHQMHEHEQQQENTNSGGANTPNAPVATSSSGSTASLAPGSGSSSTNLSQRFNSSNSFAFKENTLANPMEDEQSAPQSIQTQSSQSTSQAVITTSSSPVSSSTSNCICNQSFNTSTNVASLGESACPSETIKHSYKNTPLLNQVLGKTAISLQQQINNSSMGASSSSNNSLSMSTPPQLITPSNINLNPNPPQKKVIISKRQLNSIKAIMASKPLLFGQNTLNNMSNSSASTSGVSSASNSQSIRRSSRIFAAQNANTSSGASSSSSSLGVIKENKKLHHSGSGGSSSSSTTTITSETGGGAPGTSISTNKRLKQKKKNLEHKFSTTGTGIAKSTSSSTSSLTSSLDLKKSSVSTGSDAKKAHTCQVYSECRHCNLLLNQSKNSNLINLMSSAPLLGSSAHSALNSSNNSSSSRKDAYKINLIKQSIILDDLMKLLKDLGMAYLNLKQYECEKALGYFEQLPETQLKSSFVLSNMARAHFELHNYLKAEKIYLELRREYPYHLEGLEFYSTTLWHLQKEIGLSALAQELTEYDKLAPETWCVVGNCFSLHKEHDAAIKFFHRATQVDPKFVYAYNLLGHEYFLIEEMEKGLACFRKAIFLDPRHYNAWYGISMIHLKQEKFLLAEKYLKKALMINPHSSTLMCHIAVVYHSLKQSEKALQILDRALLIEPKNTLCKFHRASILFSMEKYDEALEEFEKLRRVIPKESLIYYMISKTHKKLKNVHLSLMYMSWAMDLDPKGVNNQLKESIDKRYVIDSDSTFARELETINTSTLDAIYGGNDLLQANENNDEEPIDTSITTTATTNNNPNNNTTNNDNTDHNSNNNSNNLMPPLETLPTTAAVSSFIVPSIANSSVTIEIGTNTNNNDEEISTPGVDEDFDRRVNEENEANDDEEDNDNDDDEEDDDAEEADEDEEDVEEEEITEKNDDEENSDDLVTEDDQQQSRPSAIPENELNRNLFSNSSLHESNFFRSSESSSVPSNNNENEIMATGGKRVGLNEMDLGQKNEPDDNEEEDDEDEDEEDDGDVDEDDDEEDNDDDEEDDDNDEDEDENEDQLENTDEHSAPSDYHANTNSKDSTNHKSDTGAGESCTQTQTTNTTASTTTTTTTSNLSNLELKHKSMRAATVSMKPVNTLQRNPIPKKKLLLDLKRNHDDDESPLQHGSNVDDDDEDLNDTSDNKSTSFLSFSTSAFIDTTTTSNKYNETISFLNQSQMSFNTGKQPPSSGTTSQATMATGASSLNQDQLMDSIEED